jgi:hypothetical protein
LPPLLKEQLFGFTQQEIFDKKSRAKIRGISQNTVLSFQINRLLDRLERDEADVEELKQQVLLNAAPFMKQIEILTSMKGVSVHHCNYCGHHRREPLQRLQVVYVLPAFRAEGGKLSPLQ